MTPTSASRRFVFRIGDSYGTVPAFQTLRQLEHALKRRDTTYVAIIGGPNGRTTICGPDAKKPAWYALVFVKDGRVICLL